MGMHTHTNLVLYPFLVKFLFCKSKIKGIVEKHILIVLYTGRSVFLSGEKSLYAKHGAQSVLCKYGD